ncbi:unnamed protein product [Toxocara canis]|uniref:C-type lectin domain-containing protein n=1 Tax=Toxocara canis TaxID=6265 RepID=A0A183UIN2_TOXCA|nr:unnamed protein product [Toxocara canis]
MREPKVALIVLDLNVLSRLRIAEIINVATLWQPFVVEKKRERFGKLQGMKLKRALQTSFASLLIDFQFTLGGVTHQNKYEEYCVRHGAHLTSIHSYDEVEFLRKNYANRERFKGFWTGMIMDEFNRWSHLDGSVVDYFRWKPNQPDNMFGKEFCVHQYDVGKWNDLRCDSNEVTVDMLLLKNRSKDEEEDAGENLARSEKNLPMTLARTLNTSPQAKADVPPVLLALDAFVESLASFQLADRVAY